ncbi:MFS transporter [Sphaerisporangium sp. TRM90804]|uniref:MFS transporter n=1 Tax=Sphaerisporangium sp. TRM90804 TaxID=3031113 RepID=UPI00244B9184|nr:MFS transporter [Sphaerisporangium sp. TRM90804]MDH2428360.1 MFS transporter [Sphaerisporangium sp. TRM90804]
MTETSSSSARATDVQGRVSPPTNVGRIRNASLLLAVVCAVQFLDAMDIASMGPALPLVQQELGMSPDTLQWVVSAYALGFGGFLLLGGRLADIFGRKKLLIGWLAVFVVASFIGGLTDGGFVLVLARLAKGISAGFTAPVAMAILLDAFRDPQSRNKALGTFLAIVSAGYSLGLVLGGLLSGISWRLVLFLPAVVGIIVAVMAMVAVPADRPREGGRPRVDILGSITVTAGAIALVYAVSRASVSGWGDSLTLGSLGAAVVLLLAFVMVERVHPTPLVPLSIFSRPQLSRANVCMLMFGAYVAFQFVLTLYYQNVLGWSPFQAGLAFLLGGVLTAATARYGAAAVTKYGAWPVATAGLLMLAVGYLGWVLLIGHVNPLVILVAQQLLGGIGFAAAYPALNIAAVGSAKEDEQGLASGLFNASSQIGTGVVIALTATLLGLNADAGLGGYRAGLWTVTAITVAITLLAAGGIARYSRRSA